MSDPAFRRDFTGFEEESPGQANARQIIEFDTIPEQRPDGSWFDKEILRIRMAGDMKQIVEKKSNDLLRKKYAREYQAFKEGREPSLDGTPLALFMGRTAEALNLFNLGIRTVEQLAAVPDSSIPDIGMGMRARIEQARAFVRAQKDTEEARRLAAVAAAQQDTIALMRQQMEQMSQRMEQMQAERQAAVVVQPAADQSALIAQMQQQMAQLMAAVGAQANAAPPATEPQPAARAKRQAQEG